MTFTELLKILQAEADRLNGKDIREKIAEDLIDETMSGLACIRPPLSVHDCRLWCATEVFGEIPFIEFQVCYPEDKRTCDGLGYHIRKIELVPIRKLSSDLDIAQLSRVLQYAGAQERRLRAMENIGRLERQLDAEKETAREMLTLMEREEKELRDMNH